MRRAMLHTRHILLLLGDWMVFFCALGLAIWIRELLGSTGLSFTQHLPPFLFIFILWTIVHVVTGLYDLSVGDTLSLLRRTSGTFLINAALAAAFFYLVPGLPIAPKTTLFLALITSWILFVAWRLAIMSAFRHSRTKTRVVFLGTSADTASLIAILTTNPTLGYVVVGVVGDAISGVSTLTLDTLRNNIARGMVDVVVLDRSPHENPQQAAVLSDALFHGVSFIDSAAFAEETTRRIPLSAITHAWFLENIHLAQKETYESGKRMGDIFGSVLLGTVTLVLLPAIALAIWLQDRGTIFFTQERLGKQGKKMFVWKFRTMIPNAEKHGEQFATKNDQRITRIGKWLRASRMDELPQCWNILIGDMSFIGPRPERPEATKDLTSHMPYYPMRLLVRPGLTGWAQIHEGYAATLDDHKRKLQYDLYYIKNRSVLLDLIIALKTLATILGAKGT